MTKFKNILMLNALRNYFFRGITEGTNLVINSNGRDNLKNGEQIIPSQIEHHANIFP